MENKCEALPGVAYPGVRDNRSTLNTKTGYDDDDECSLLECVVDRPEPADEGARYKEDEQKN